MKMDSLVKGAAVNGIERYGITDHIHTQYNYPDILNSKKAYKENQDEGFFFGIEVSCVSEWELNLISSGFVYDNITYGIRQGGPRNGPLAIAINEEFIKSHDIKFVVAGTHWPMYVEPVSSELIKDYHRQNMFLSQHGLVDIVAHPWWCLGPCENSWINDFSLIPQSMHREFAASCIENNKLVEINLSAMLLTIRYSEKFKKEYIEYLVFLKELGVHFSIGSDCHNEFYDIDFTKASSMLESAGFTGNEFFSPVL